MQDIRIMIVESEEARADRLKERLEELGFTICGLAHSGAEALNLTQDLDPDLILMCTRLPGGLNGWQVAEEINRHSVVPMIFTTNHDDTNAALRMDGADPNQPIINPFLDNNLPITIEVTYLQQDRARLLELVAARSRELEVAKQRLRREFRAHKQTRQALAESERRMRALLENVQLIAIIVDASGNLTFCNDQLLDLTGWTREDVLGENWFDRFVTHKWKAKREYQQAITQGEIEAQSVQTIYTRAGEKRLISWRHTTLYNAGGKIVGVVSIGEDITV